MIPIVTPDEMRVIDQTSTDPLEVLIARAGWHIARVARELLGGVYGRRVCVIAGPGTNGADGRVAAGWLGSWGVGVDLVDPTASSIPTVDLVIDAAFGTGLNRPYRAPHVPRGTPVLAVDTPSGIDALTGELLGAPLAATKTVTFAALKPGLLLLPGAGLVGELEVASVGLDTTSANAWLFTDTDAGRLLPRRASTDHKWRRAVWVIGGSNGMVGAPLLAAQAALRSGSGMVRCGLPGQVPPPLVSEVVFGSLPAAHWHDDVLRDAHRFGALVVGCGIGRSSDTAAAIQALVAHTDRPMVVDADALVQLGDRPSLRPDIVLTPHDGEYRALTGGLPSSDRFSAARILARQTGATVLLKGPLTIVAAPDGRCIASASGDARLATAGTGDVLAGIVGSFLAAGLEPLEAAAMAAWIHGEAGRSQPPFGMVASDILSGLPLVLQRVASAHTEGSDASN